MSTRPHRSALAVILFLMLSALSAAARAEEATGKVAWIDARNSSLLLECHENGCPKIPDFKPSETYIFVFPASLSAAILALKEGDIVKIAYDDGKEKGYVITSVRRTSSIQRNSANPSESR